jgi:hypothetical protein
MTNNYSWIKYNLNIQKLINQNIAFNKKFMFNAVDNSYYTQTRDIFALVANTSKVINILDFGSNLSLISNLSNKIDTRAKKFFVYDPFYSLKDDVKIKNINYKIFSNLTDIIKIKFDLIHFGSCIQYIKNFDSYLKILKLNNKSKILFTATPFNLYTKYKTKQINQKNLFQIVHNYHDLCKLLKLKKFDIIFKSSMNVKLAKLKTVKPNTYFLNILFQMK